MGSSSCDGKSVLPRCICEEKKSRSAHVVLGRLRCKLCLRERTLKVAVGGKAGKIKDKEKGETRKEKEERKKSTQKRRQL